MSLDKSYFDYPWRRHGMDHERYDWQPAPKRKKIAWPDGAPVALNIMPVLEFNPLNPKGKPFKAPGAMQTPWPDLRHFTTRDYGNRIGIFRIMQALDKRGLKASVPINSDVAKRTPMLVEEITSRGWEVIAHGVNMDALHYGGMDEGEERAQIQECLSVLRDASGQPVTGWMSPAMSESWKTPDLLAAEGVQYVCDWVNDDLPYEMRTESGPLWAMPNSQEWADRKILIDLKQTEASYVQQIKDTFDCFYEEAKAGQGGRILTLPLVPYVIGIPYRIQCLEEVLDHICQYDGVWSATSSEILAAWQEK